MNNDQKSAGSGSGYWQVILKVITGSPEGISRKSIAHILKDTLDGREDPRLIQGLETLKRSGRIRESLGKDENGDVCIICQLDLRFHNLGDLTARDKVGLVEEDPGMKEINPDGIIPTKSRGNQN